METWECDGCGRHITCVNDKDPKLTELCCPASWGYMLVGGLAHKDYHELGIHPMSMIVDGVKELTGHGKVRN